MIETTNAHVTALRERGYTIFRSLYSAAEMDALSATMHRLHAEAGAPACHAPEPVRLAPEIELCTTGLVFYKFVKRCPEHVDLVTRPALVDAIRGYVGDDMWLELTGAVIADATRPFFAWHTHIGGIDDSKYRRAGIWPRFEAPQRVMTLLYVDDLEEDNGPLLVHPRTVRDPTEPPHDPYARDWPGQDVITVPRGSVVVMDQCTWHAVRQKQSPGIRSFVGCYYRSAAAPPTEWEDESLLELQAPDPLLQSILPPAARG